MHRKAIVTFVGAAVLALTPISNLTAGELLLNGSFETPVQATDGDHDGVLPASWTVAANPYTNTSVAADSNLVRGTVTDPSATVSISPYDGSQALDGVNGNYYVSQTITLASASALHIQCAIGGRNGNSATGTGSYFQLGTVGLTGGNPTSFTPIVTSATVKPVTGTYSFLAQNTQVLAAGTYRFTVFLGDPDHVDAVSITTVPEPSTLALAGLGAGWLGWAGLRRCRRA